MASPLPLCTPIKSTACVKGQVKKQMSNRNCRHRVAAPWRVQHEHVSAGASEAASVTFAFWKWMLNLVFVEVYYSCLLSVLCAISKFSKIYSLMPRSFFPPQVPNLLDKFDSNFGDAVVFTMPLLVHLERFFLIQALALDFIMAFPKLSRHQSKPPCWYVVCRASLPKTNPPPRPRLLNPRWELTWK